MFSILHISDLHRSPTDPVDNATLVSSLLSDRDRYTTGVDAIRAPDAIIVSGDVVQGARLGDNEWEKEVRRQYDTAEEFLSLLADSFLGGDRSRVVIVPGNHDVCWNTAHAAMTEITSKDAISKLSPQQLFDPGGSFRWCWKTKSPFEITDRAVYERKNRQYLEFLERFYQHTELEFGIQNDHNYNLFSLDDGRILVAGFDSTYGNDCFAFHGAFHRDSIGRCDLEIRQSQFHPEVKIAAWHHGLYAPPTSSDYMDTTFVDDLIGCGFSLGVHGHQHKAATNAYYVHLPEKVAMPVVSAGSLCAGSRELPVGQNRQYNIVVISDDYRSARVFVRERGPGNQFRPCSRPEFGLNGAIDLDLPPIVDSVGRERDRSKTLLRQAVLNAEALIANNRFSEAAELLRDSSIDDGYCRQLFLDAAQRAERPELLIDVLQPPVGLAEHIAVAGALRATGKTTQALALANGAISAFPEGKAVLTDLIDRLNTELEFKQP